MNELYQQVISDKPGTVIPAMSTKQTRSISCHSIWTYARNAIPAMYAIIGISYLSGLHVAATLGAIYMALAACHCAECWVHSRQVRTHSGANR